MIFFQKTVKNIFIIIFAGCVFFTTPAVYASVVQDQLKSTLDQLFEVLENPSLIEKKHTKERQDAIYKVISPRFSFAKMSQLCLGRHWRTINNEEKKTFIKLFGQLLEQTYVAKIEGYTNEKVVFGKEIVKKKRAQVSTKIVTDTIEIPIDYRLFPTEDNIWMIYDVVVEGVSLVGNYRSQFDQILQKGKGKDSFEKLIKELKKKIEN